MGDMDGQLRTISDNSRLLIRQGGLENHDAGEMNSTDEPVANQPIALDQLPEPLRKLYAKSVKDLRQDSSVSTMARHKTQSTIILNEPLLGGFALLRAAQLINIDVYYIGLESRSCRMNSGNNCWLSGDDVEAIAGKNVSIVRSCSSLDRIQFNENHNHTDCYTTILDDLASYNPLQGYIDRHEFLKITCKLAKIFLSLVAIIIGLTEVLSTIVMCLMIIGKSTSSSLITETAKDANENKGMGLFVLVLVQLSSIYILFLTIFNGHLLWNLFSQRQFLVSKRFQCKTMLKLLVFIYLEYLINAAFISNLYDWSSTSNNIESDSYSVFANLRIVVTFKDLDHHYVDIMMTIILFARGIIRISPYITINYAIICLREHISTIRNQHLLTDSFKKRQRLRLVVGKTNHRRNESKAICLLNGNRIKKKVNFVTEPMDRTSNLANGDTTSGASDALTPARRQKLRTFRSYDTDQQTIIDRITTINDRQTVANKSPLDDSKEIFKLNNQENLVAQIEVNKRQVNDNKQLNRANRKERRNSKDLLLERIKDFDELESYITNLYIFTGKLNRFMSSQGLTVFFIVHNLVISVSLIIPEAIEGGVVMVQFVRVLLILIAILPFIYGQSLSVQLEQLSRQIDRIIIQQHFIHRRRDNLVRIRELIHDIKVNCGGMLNFNVATGIKYLVVAFASAFFIEQEHYKLTRRHHADDITPKISWVVGFPTIVGGNSS